ncbi:IclR family transcriptional regulator C-terminal domain-containing protein [Paraburkholderia lacunae]|uniref:IclR family transcriptional regulator C-terminal domain-containing protein n=1 Tax=Paraburkholderia lacunae TaxID=2211104 RepID=UPI001FCC6843|nr:IclR family transcriptional regulator C-terminal domain-containing protein [Paraburkholderia lacunae]
MRGVAVPLRNHNGIVIGAISVSMPTGQESGNAALPRVRAVLQETATMSPCSSSRAPRSRHGPAIVKRQRRSMRHAAADRR